MRQHRIRRATTSAVLVMLAALALACGSRRRGSSPAATVLFENQSLYQADVYVVRPGGSPMRIGTVFAGGREALRVPTVAAGGGETVTLVARLFTVTRRPSSGPFTIASGTVVEVTLASDARLLTVLPARRQEKQEP